MATDMLQYLDPDGLDETVLNIGQIKTSLEGQISDLEESIEEEMQNLPYARPDGLYPDMTVGAVIGADSTAQWATRESTGTGSAIVRSVQGAAVAWNQMVGSDTPSVTVPSGHKYLGIIGGTAAIATSDGTAVSVTGGTDQLFDLTAMFGSGNEPSTVAEFEQMYPEPYYPYDAGTLLPVRMKGIETVGFNQWDEQWEVGSIDDSTGMNTITSQLIRSKNYIPMFPSTEYYANLAGKNAHIYCYDAAKSFIGYISRNKNGTFTTLAGTAYIRFRMNTAYGTTYKHDICINISDPALNGQYKPYTTDGVEWEMQTLRAAGSVRDELTSDELVTRVGERAYQSGDESDVTVRTDGTTTYYPLATPATTPINPALQMSYRVQQGGAEFIIAPDGEVSAAPVLTVAEPVNAGDEFARIWAAIESLGYTRNAAQLSRPISLTDVGSVDEVQKETADVVEKEAADVVEKEAAEVAKKEPAEVAEIDTVKEVQE